MHDKQAWLRMRARQMRTQPTEAEALLWRALRGRRFAGFKFRRQHPGAGRIVDFVCPARGLVVEVDGSQHAENLADAARDACLRQRGYRVLRFWNHDVLARQALVLDEIWRHLHA